MLASTKARLSFMINSPRKAFSGFWQDLLCKFKVPPQVEEMRRLTREAPLFLQIETINTCNAGCIFCAYRGMKRKKGVMSLSLFQKVIESYAELGGGSVNLTPIMGDALLDSHLLERLEILEKYPEIKQVTVTTNGIALEKYSDAQIRRLLESLSRIQVSIGGLDAATYKTMYSIDRFQRVIEGVERLLTLRENVKGAALVSLAFRTNDRKFESRFKPQLDSFRARGAKVSHMCVYGNYSGAVKEDGEKGLAVYTCRGKKHLTCVYPCMNMVVCWDGAITACCADFEGNELRIGHAEEEKIVEVWAGERRAAILNAFEKRELLPICRKCSGYLPDTVFANACFSGFRPHQPLPDDFFLF